MQIDHYLIGANRRAHRLRDDRSYVMGRDQSVDIVVQDAMSSRRHAELVCHSGHWMFKDLGSRNGTLINGERVQDQQRLTDQDRIQIGGQVYQYYMVPPGCDLGRLSDQAPQIENDVTVGAGVSAADIFTAGATFSGSVSAGGLFELLQFLAQTRKSGRMHVLNRGAPQGSVGVAEGAVRDCACHDRSGIDALVELVELPSDAFAFHSGQAAGEIGEPIQGSAEGVLMELARCVDERTRRASG